jgi:tellurite resistance protein
MGYRRYFDDGVCMAGGQQVDEYTTERMHATPPWIVPVVGMIDIPLAVPALELDSVQGVIMLFLAVGLFFAVPLSTQVLSLLLFQEPVPPSVQPSLLIFLALFFVGFPSYVTTVGGMDAFAKALYMLKLSFSRCWLVGCAI